MHLELLPAPCMLMVNYDNHFTKGNKMKLSTLSRCGSSAPGRFALLMQRQTLRLPTPGHPGGSHFLVAL